MTAKGHLLFALSSIILAKKFAISVVLAQGDWWHIITGAMIICLLPDIDHPKSVLGQLLFFVSIFISYVFGHRGFTHSLLAVILLNILFTLFIPQDVIPLDVYHAMIIGYMSHIISDMITPFGVPLLWPCRWRFSIPLLQSTKNRQQEQLICVIVLIFAFILIYFN